MRKFILLCLTVILCGCGIPPEQNEPVQDIPECPIEGKITASTKEEYAAAQYVINTLFNALEAGDKDAIKDLFSEYAINNTENLDSSIEKLIQWYPGAENGYTSSSVTSEGHDRLTRYHALEIKLKVESMFSYTMKITMYMRNDYDP